MNIAQQTISHLTFLGTRLGLILISSVTRISLTRSGGLKVRLSEDSAAFVVMTRATHRLSLERIEQAAQIIDPVFMHTPQFVSEPLNAG